jgi:hypothetical protein
MPAVAKAGVCDPWTQQLHGYDTWCHQGPSGPSELHQLLLNTAPLALCAMCHNGQGRLRLYLATRMTDIRMTQFQLANVEKQPVGSDSELNICSSPNFSGPCLWLSSLGHRTTMTIS